MSETESRTALALSMISTLPTWGTWAASMREVDTPYGRIGFRQASIMWILRYEHVPLENRTTTGIASHLGIQNSVVTRACERLEHLGLLLRTVDKTDRRRSFVGLTNEGRAASIYIQDLYIHSIIKAMAELDDTTIAELQRTVNILSNVSAELFRHAPGQ